MWDCGLYSQVREGNPTTDVTRFCESTVLLLDTMQCNLSVHKVCVWTEFGVVIKLHYSLYYTNDLSDPDATDLTWPLNKRGGCDSTRNMISLSFTTGLRQSVMKLWTHRFPDFVFFLRSLFSNRSVHGFLSAWRTIIHTYAKQQMTLQARVMYLF